MDKVSHCEGVRFHSKRLEVVSPGFYVDTDGERYFCASEFLFAHDLPLEMELVQVALEQVLERFPGITVIEFAE